MFEEIPEGSPETEKQTLASQASLDARLRALVREHYGPVYCLASALLNDSAAARQVCLAAFEEARLELGRSSKSRGHPNWLYAAALKAIQHQEHLQGKAAKPAEAEPEDPIWQAVDAFGKKERLLAILYYVLGWNLAQAAALLHVGAGAVQIQLELFSRIFQEKLVFPGEPKKKLGKKAASQLEERVKASLQARWPAPLLTEAEIDGLMAEVLQPSKGGVTAARRLVLPGALGLAGIAILVTVCLAAGAVVLVLRLQPAKSGPPLSLSGPVTTELGLPTAIPSHPQAQALTRYSNSGAVLQRLRESPGLWSTLWIDVQIIHYGPASYNGPPKLTRDQAWIAQPAQSIELSGLLADKPDSLYQVTGGKTVYMAPFAGETATSNWDSSLRALLRDPTLRNMVFPGDAPWASQPGSFKIRKTEDIAGRRTVQAEWTNAQGLLGARLWVDDRTGIILHMQEFGGENGQTLLTDALATEIFLDASYPPAVLAENVRLANGDLPPWADAPQPEQTILKPTPTLSFQLAGRAFTPSDPAPVGFDPSKSHLKFQFPGGPELADTRKNTAQMPAELVADEYSLGVVKFGLPWALRCSRSPDGLRLAFNTGTDGTTQPDETMRWFDLTNLKDVYTLLPGVKAVDFAFSPDSRSLAVFGYGEGDKASGIYLVELATGASRLAIELQQGSSLVWNPDGESLALIGRETIDSPLEAMVVHLRTGMITNRMDASMLSSQPAEWPVPDWGVDFPVEMGGMDGCANPPGS